LGYCADVGLRSLRDNRFGPRPVVLCLCAAKSVGCPTVPVPLPLEVGGRLLDD